MTNFAYTDSFEPDSSVISEVFFDGNNDLLIVVLHSGTRAGYANVTASTFELFKEYFSAGAFWNQHIKNNPDFPGFDTADYTLVEFEPAPRVEDSIKDIVSDDLWWNSNVFHVNSSTPVSLGTTPEPEPVVTSQPSKVAPNAYLFNFDVVTVDEVENTVYAHDIEAAKELVRKDYEIHGKKVVFRTAQVTQVIEF